MYLFISCLIFILSLLLSVAFLTLVERKLLAVVQKRRGPNIVGYGLFQPLADGLKLVIKEMCILFLSNKTLFFLAPILAFSFSIIIHGGTIYGDNISLTGIDLGILYIFAISSLAVYSVLLSGWSSNSRYAFLGGIRSTAQMVSYEVSIGIILLNVVALVGSLNLNDIVFFQQHIYLIIPFFPLFLMFFISSLAETNRPPFDLPEAEAELVSGYNIEYSGAPFAAFFIGEYANIIFMATFSSMIFFGGPISSFLPFGIALSIKVTLLVLLFLFVRSVLPRFRYDQLMSFGFKVMLPISLSFFLLTTTVLFIFNWLPITY